MSIAVAEGHRADRAESQPGGRATARSARNRLAWPEKAGLVIALIAAAMSVFACAIVLIVGETVTYGRLNNTLAIWAGMAVLAIAGPPWLLMRVIDALAGGPSRRHMDRAHRST